MKIAHGYEININLEYKVIHSKELVDEVMSNYLNGKRFMYEHVTHHKTISIAKRSDTIINESINVPRRSMRGLMNQVKNLSIKILMK